MIVGTPLLRKIALSLLRPLGTTRWLGTVTRVDTSQPLVALTFDDGPHPDSTPRILDVLEGHDARATFFVVGESARRYPGLIKDMIARDHEIANHTWTHPAFRTLTSGKRRSELARCGDQIGPDMARLFRPPWGDASLAARVDILRAGYRVVGWDVHVQDWLDISAETISERLRRGIRPGSIVLLHDALFATRDEDEIQSDRSALIQGLDHFLDTADNLRFVSVSHLLKAGRPVYERQGW
jgi:peptidoglycan/xylan/chitin deacetylase (PgdA/CDA1 family)